MSGGRENANRNGRNLWELWECGMGKRTGSQLKEKKVFKWLASFNIKDTRGPVGHLSQERSKPDDVSLLSRPTW